MSITSASLVIAAVAVIVLAAIYFVLWGYDE